MFNIFKKLRIKVTLLSKIIICHMIILLFQRYIKEILMMKMLIYLLI